MSSRPATTPLLTERYPLPIYLFLTGLTLWALLSALLTAPGGVEPLRGALLGALLAAHLWLHWQSAQTVGRAGAWLQYTLAQGGIAIALTFGAGAPSLWAALFTWLVGETIGMQSSPRLSALALALHGAFAVAALFAITDSATALQWLGAILPTTLFVGLVVVLYRRQSEAREQAQQLVAELERANRRISAYAEQVEGLTLTNERQRMARELHDTLSQNVAGLALQLEAVDAHLEAGRQEKAQEIVRQAVARARETLKETRAAIDNLRARDTPISLSERLVAHCRDFQQESGISCEWIIGAGAETTHLSAAQGEHLERALGEGLANVRRHACASHVAVELTRRGDVLTLRITDDGVGFDGDDVPPQGHYGLRGLRERAALLGGALDIHSAPGKGTVLQFTVPLTDIRNGAADEL